MLNDSKWSSEPRPLVISVNDCCRALDCGRDRLYALLGEGLIESFLDGPRTRKIVVASVERYIAKRVEESKNKLERSRYPVRNADGTTVQVGIGAKPKAAQSEAVPRRRKRSGVIKNGIPAQGAE
jgi:hypothetical protein